jgi:hypothetical protein
MALSTQEREGFIRSWGTLLMRTWEDEDFKAEFQSDPARVMNENGVAIQDGANVELVTPPADAGPDLDKQIELYAEGQETGNYTFYVQDSQPVETEEMTEKELEGVSAGASSSTIVCCCCCT